MEIIGNLDAPVIEMDAPGLIEINASLANIGVVLVGIPRVLEHDPDTIEGLSSASYHARRRSTGVRPLIAALSFMPWLSA